MSKKNRFVLNMTEGDPYSLLLKFAVPLFIGNIFQQLYNLVDSIVVGNYVGTDQLGAIGTTGSLQFFFFSLVGGLSMGIGIIIAQYYGAGDDNQVKNTIGNAIWILMACSMIMACIGFFLARPLLTLMKTDPRILDDAVNYLRVTSVGILCIGMYHGVSSVLRALGDSKTPLFFLIFASLVNVGLDVLFVLGFGMGVVGAGVATVLSQLLAAITCIVYAYCTNTYFRLKPLNFKLRPELLSKSCRLGIPVALQNALIAFSLIVLQSIVNSYGKTFTASFTVVTRIEQLVQQPFMSLGAALSTYTGQNIGAGKIKRVLRGFRADTVISSTIAVCIMILFWIFAPFIVRIFGDDPEVRRIAVDGLRINSVFYIFLGLIYTTRNVLNGAGDAMFSLLSGIVECIGRVFVAYPLTLIPFMGKYGVFYATGLTWFLNGMFSFVRYKRGKWKKMNVVNRIVEE